jgi:hypothetical protein
LDRNLNHSHTPILITKHFSRIHSIININNFREGDNLKYPGINGTIILNWISEKWDGSPEWIDVAQDREEL